MKRTALWLIGIGLAVAVTAQASTYQVGEAHADTSQPLVLTAHSPLGPWLGEQYSSAENWANVQMDPATGLPKTVYPWGTYFYPITVAHYGLQQYSKWTVNGGTGFSKAKLVGDWLVRNQDSRGGWPIPFTYDFRKGVTSTLPAGWYDGMAQGMASTLLAKLYAQTGNWRYRAAALKSLDVLSTPIELGGVLRKWNGAYEWWEKYPTRNHPTYVLNGFIYALVGVYDTAVILRDARARGLYERGLRSLQRMVNLYDLGDRTSYDLLHFDVPGSPPNVARWGYHSTHVMLLSAMNVITGGKFASIQRRWLGYSNGIPAPHN